MKQIRLSLVVLSAVVSAVKETKLTAATWPCANKSAAIRLLFVVQSKDSVKSKSFHLLHKIN